MWRVITVIVAGLLLAGCSDDSDDWDRSDVTTAVREYMRGYDENRRDLVCPRTFVSSDLRNSYAERLLGGSWSPDESVGDWEKSYRACLRRWESGQPRPYKKPTILRVKLGGPTDEKAGISASAKVRATRPGAGPWTYKLVRYEDDWKVVFEVR